MAEHDSHMPKGWHTIKSVLFTELATAGTFHLCCRAADALFHARLLGEAVVQETLRHEADNRACAPELEGGAKPTDSTKETG